MPETNAVHILLVDDDPTVSEVVGGYLQRAGFVVEYAQNGDDALHMFATRRPNLVVLDRMLPGRDGIDVCQRIREISEVPVVMLTALGEPDERILGLEVGADDYVAKPFSPRELVLRVQSVLRRTAPLADPGAVSVENFVVDTAARTATYRGAPLALTIREFDLLAFLIRHPGQVFGRQELMRMVWGWEFGDLSTVTVHVRRLRGKIEQDAAHPRYLKTVWGVGYRFDLDEDA